MMRAAMEKLLILMAAAAFDLSSSAAAAWTFSARCVAAASPTGPAGSSEEEVVEEAGEASSAEMLLPAASAADGGDGMCGVERFGEIILWSVCPSVSSELSRSISSVPKKLGLKNYESGLSSEVTVTVLLSLWSLKMFSNSSMS